MANFKYFADVDGETFELTSIRFDGSKRGPAQFSGRASNGVLLTATRYIEYKRNPSKHICDSRCLNATGKVMKCECSCGGKNHGKGHALAVAA